MRLGGEVKDFVGAGFREDAVHDVGITDVGLDKSKARLSEQVGERRQIAGVGQLIDDRDLVSGGMREPGEIRSDEAGAAGDKEFHLKRMNEGERGRLVYAKAISKRTSRYDEKWGRGRAAIAIAAVLNRRREDYRGLAKSLESDESLDERS